MLAVFAALTVEARCLERHLARRQRAWLEGFPIIKGQHAGRAVLLCRSGPGQQALAAARVVLAHYSPRCVLSLGFAGGVAETLRAGDILICQRMYLWDEQEPVPEEESDERLMELAEAAAQRRSLPYHKGYSATTLRLLGLPAEKAEVARRLSVQVVEMESYWLARVARERRVPFLALRAVVDRAGDTLPAAFASTTEAGNIRWRPLVAFLGTHPGSLPQFGRLASNALRASRSLTLLAGELLELWSRETPREIS